MGATQQPRRRAKVFVESHVHRVFEEQLPIGGRDHMPARYLELEEQRLVKLLTEWLEFERTRNHSTSHPLKLQNRLQSRVKLTLKLRLDRVDRLGDGSLLVMDDKTGAVSPQPGNFPAPTMCNCPLYAGFAVPSREQVGGLGFAKSVRARWNLPVTSKTRKPRWIHLSRALPA